MYSETFFARLSPGYFSYQQQLNTPVLLSRVDLTTLSSSRSKLRIPCFPSTAASNLRGIMPNLPVVPSTFSPKPYREDTCPWDESIILGRYGRYDSIFDNCLYNYIALNAFIIICFIRNNLVHIKGPSMFSTLLFSQVLWVYSDEKLLLNPVSNYSQFLCSLSVSVCTVE